MNDLISRAGKVVGLLWVFLVGLSLLACSQVEAHGEERPLLPTPVALPTVVPQVMQLGAPEGKVDFRDLPCGSVVRFTGNAGTQVRVVERVEACGVTWYRAVLVEGNGEGWVPASALVDPTSGGPTFGSFRWSAGTVARPLANGAPLSYRDGGLWILWDYTGLRVGDMVEVVLLVNGERYSSAPRAWSGPASGQHLLNVLTLQPRSEAGEWMLWFFVNGEYVGQASATVR